MPRIRTIKPECSFNDRLFDLEKDTGFPIRFVWAVLPCHCDREGRFEYQPRRMQPQILPFDSVDFSRVLDALWSRGFIEKYEESGVVFGVIPTFLKHQVVNNREKASELPIPNKNNILTCDGREIHASFTRKSRVPQGREGKGKEGKGMFYEKIADEWNPVLSPIGKSKFVKWSDVRKKHFKARCEEDKSRDLDWWLNLIRDIPNHKMAMSENWFDLEFLIKSENNLVKFCEGKYKKEFEKDNKSGLKDLTDDQLFKKAESMKMPTIGMNRNQLISAIEARQ